MINQNQMIEDNISQFSSYRFPSLNPSSNVTQQQRKPGIFCTLSSSYSKSSCHCDKIKGKCQLSLKWLQSVYSSSQYPKLQKVFDDYLRNNKFDLQDIRQQMDLDIASVKSSYDIKNEKQLRQVLECFAKHNIYYRKRVYCKIFVWMAASLMYHADMCTSFWILDALSDVFKLREEQHESQMKKIAENVYYKIGIYFRVNKRKIEEQGVDLKKVVQYLVSDLMFSYIPLEYSSYCFQHIINKGTTFFQKLVLSYLDKRFDTIKEKKINGKQFLMMNLLNNDKDWPIIFCGMNSFKF